MLTRHSTCAIHQKHTVVSCGVSWSISTDLNQTQKSQLKGHSILINVTCAHACFHSNLHNMSGDVVFKEFVSMVNKFVIMFPWLLHRLLLNLSNLLQFTTGLLYLRKFSHV